MVKGLKNEMILGVEWIGATGAILASEEETLNVCMPDQATLIKKTEEKEKVELPFPDVDVVLARLEPTHPFN